MSEKKETSTTRKKGIYDYNLADTIKILIKNGTEDEEKVEKQEE